MISAKAYLFSSSLTIVKSISLEIVESTVVPEFSKSSIIASNASLYEKVGNISIVSSFTRLIVSRKLE